jgi:hypothetical protein
MTMNASDLLSALARPVIHAAKDVENRTAPQQFRSAVGQRVLIHASSHHLNWADIAAGVACLKERGVACPSRSDLTYGSVIGSVLVTGIVTGHRSPWFRGPYALVFADPRPEPFRPAKGQVGLFRVRSHAQAIAFSHWMVGFPSKSP